jgi:hypothetical protein
MSENNGNEEFVQELNELVNEGKKIIIFNSQKLPLLRIMITTLMHERYKDILFWHTSELTSSAVNIKHITQEQMLQFLDLYYLYDFSDKVIVVSDSELYGSLNNYLNTEIITLEEIAEALLYNL